MRDVEVFRQLARLSHQVLRANVADLTHEESLIQPEPAGNCMNWVVGHVLHVYSQVLTQLGQTPVLSQQELARYARGSQPLRDGTEALRFERLVDAWDESWRRVDAGLEALTPEALAAPAPPGFGENVRDLLGFVFFHQAYHSGQAGILRRIAGREGAIR
jgi:uncharacterized damage-inducible protein DinB